MTAGRSAHPGGPPGHRGSRAPAVVNLTFSIDSGDALGVVGASAAGKSTLARLIVGAVRPTQGVVRLDGADVWSWDRREFGKVVGYVPQDIELFDGSVKDNIARFSDADPHAIVDAARLAGVHDMILRLPQGYETSIGATGAILAGPVAWPWRGLALGRRVPRFPVSSFEVKFDELPD